jgi:ketosteroid isomerase-like protein
VGKRFCGGDLATEIAVAHVEGDIAYTARYERGETTIDGEPKSVTIRVTHIYRREAGEKGVPAIRRWTTSDAI